jgi:hypothetical protein
MRFSFVLFCVAILAFPALGQQRQTEQPTMPTQFGVGESPKLPPNASPEAKLGAMFQVKVKAEWEAIKSKDKKAYGDLLAEDYQGVEVDGKGERTKRQAIDELADTNVSNYILWGFKLIPAGPNAALVIYEVTMQFPPKSQVRFSRVYISELWEKRAGEWKEVHYQETHVK